MKSITKVVPVHLSHLSQAPLEKMIWELTTREQVSLESAQETIAHQIDQWAAKNAPPGVAWETTRSGAVEAYNLLTGFEPYFLGQGLDATIIAKRVAEIGCMVQNSIRNHYSTRMLRTIQHALADQSAPLYTIAVHEIHTQLGMVTARLRAQRGLEARRYAAQVRSRIPMEPLRTSYDFEHSTHIVTFRGATEIMHFPERPSFQELEAPGDSFARYADDPAHPYGFMNLLGEWGDPQRRALIRLILE